MAMNRRQRRAFMRQWDAQIEQERNGAPIPGEIAERMTKPKPEVVLEQVCVDQLGENGVRTMRLVGPAMIPDAAAAFANAINKMVAAGREKTWANARTVACMPLQGVN